MVKFLVRGGTCKGMKTGGAVLEDDRPWQHPARWSRAHSQSWLFDQAFRGPCIIQVHTAVHLLHKH